MDHHAFVNLGGALNSFNDQMVLIDTVSKEHFTLKDPTEFFL